MPTEINNIKLDIIPNTLGDNITNNQTLMKNISLDPYTNKIINITKQGIPIITLGQNDPKVAITSGVHGNELSPQAATLKLIKNLKNSKINGTIYIIPFAAPKATKINSRWLNGLDLNRSALTKNSNTFHILNHISELKPLAVADFHSTKRKSNPGIESIFCSKNPCIESFNIAKFITNTMSSKIITYNKAGSVFNGTLEDEFNLKNIPAITCEVLSENGIIEKNSIERSLSQMNNFLKYFNIIM